MCKLQLTKFSDHIKLLYLIESCRHLPLGSSVPIMDNVVNCATT